ncbi:hypothetical protein AURDEDRAFT_70827, partial [Auricularia subglabra TFB-10046 SS5]
DTPGFTYYQSLWPTEVNWGFKAAAQAGAGDRELVSPRGKVLARACVGSSAINDVHMNRPGQIEIEVWRRLFVGQDVADHWSWDTFYAALKESEPFTPPSDAIRREADIQWEPSHHGTSGVPRPNIV